MDLNVLHLVHVTQHKKIGQGLIEAASSATSEGLSQPEPERCTVQC